MVRKNEIFGIAIIAVLCVLLIAFSQKETANFHRHIRYQSIEITENLKVASNVTIVEPTIQEVVNRQEELLAFELADYEFPQGMNLEDFTMSSGGNPIRTVIITTWRSGSTFLGDVLNAVPGNYYHYEPLLHYDIVQIRGPPLSRTAIPTLKHLLNCNYTKEQTYLQYGKSHVYLFTHNTRLWNQCEVHPHYCWNSTFLNKICKLFPFQSMKTVRLRLWPAEELLKDDLLNIKIILLVRDPRGTLQSRKHRDWCPDKPDCDQPNNLCADMVDDYKAAIQLSKKYPTRFRFIRYEDLSLHPEKNVRDLFNYLGLDFHANVQRFLDSHTKINVGGVSSTFRDSKSTPFHWRTELNVSEVQYIEGNCEEAMDLWGYLRFDGSTSLKDFNPLASQYPAEKLNTQSSL